MAKGTDLKKLQFLIKLSDPCKQDIIFIKLVKIIINHRYTTYWLMLLKTREKQYTKDQVFLYIENIILKDKINLICSYQIYSKEMPARTTSQPNIYFTG